MRLVADSGTLRDHVGLVADEFRRPPSFVMLAGVVDITNAMLTIARDDRHGTSRRHNALLLGLVLSISGARILGTKSSQVSRSPKHEATTRTQPRNSPSPSATTAAVEEAGEDIASREVVNAAAKGGSRWTKKRALQLIDSSEGVAGPGSNIGHARDHVPLAGQDPRALVS